MEIFICNMCQKEFKSIIGLSRHSMQKHNMDIRTTYVNTILNGKVPKCKCGCGGDAPFISAGKGFCKFIQSHHNRVPGKNNYHKNPETHQKAIEAQKKNWKNGKYKGWWENNDDNTRQKIEGIKEKLRNNKERGRKISNSLTGIPKTEEAKINASNTQKLKYKNNPELRINLSKKRLRWMKDNSKVKTSKLEDRFSLFLDNMGLIKDIDYFRNHLIENIGTFYDFFIPVKKIMIEVDGDYYHCNPNTIHKIPKYSMQKKNLTNDKRKNTWCKNHNIKLLRYWEKDINERPEWVMLDLKSKIL